MNQDPGDIVERLDAVPDEVVARAKSVFAGKSGEIEYAVADTTTGAAQRPLNTLRFVHPNLALTVAVATGEAASALTVTIDPPMAVLIEVHGLETVVSAKTQGGQAQLTNLPHGTVCLRVLGAPASPVIETEPFRT